MLEWYRVAYDHWQLMDDIQRPVGSCILDDETLSCERLKLSGGFLRHTWIRSFRATCCRARILLHEHTEYGLQEEDRDTL